jgi:tryptophan synthase alpha chain
VTTPLTVRSAVADAFATARGQGRAALVGYLPAGFPSVDGGIAAMQAMVAGGADVIEVGFPYSDPVMDGPTIQRASEIALHGGTRTADVLRTVEAVAATGVPVLVMTYWNPVEHFGVDRFAQAVAAAGGAGLITPDLIPDEAGPWLDASDANGLERVFLVSPSSTDVRIAAAARASRGFLYATSVMGVTGARSQTSAQAPQLVARIRTLTDAPVGVGLGVSDGRQAAEVAGYADGVIVGSAFVRSVLDAQDEGGAVRAVATLAADLAAGVRSSRRT